jgi:hypothetical protein
MAKMNDDELRAITDGEMRNAVGYWSGKLASQRQKAMVYYLGEPKLDLSPPEVDGRSAVVSPDVRNTIESMLPQLMVKFSGSDTVVEFEATKPGDEPKAEQATDYINHLYHVKNDGERITYNWMKDALLSKNGIVKVWWDTRNEETREEYNGLTDIELTQLVDDDEIEVTEQESYPDGEDAEQRQQALEQLQQQLDQAVGAAHQNPQAAQAIGQIQQHMQSITQQPPKMLWDVVCKRTKKGGCVKVENVPPEEFLISRKAKSIADAPFVGHRVQRTMSELKSMGYKNIDNISSDDQAASLNMERVERLSWDDELAYLNTDGATNLDDSQRVVWLTECYLRVDFDGDGIAELRKVVRAGNQILDNEIVDVAPFVSITPIPMPHKFFGMSVADLSVEAQKIKTAILRGMLDNMYLQINGRYFAVTDRVNLDDLLTSRPGGVVRMKEPGMAGRLDQGMGDSSIGMNMMEFMQGFLEDSSGWTRYNQGSDGDSLNQTATGVNQITNRADMRLDLIARNFAEGFREMFRLMLKLCSQYQQREEVVKLRGQWVPINPREWRNGFDIAINVGLGTGNKDQQVQHLMMLMGVQEKTLPIGVANPKTVYETAKELTKALGFKSGDKFFTDPSQNPQPQQPHPEQIKAQANMQIEQAKMQAQQQIEQAKLQTSAQLEQAKMAAQQQVDVNRQRAEAEQHQLKMQSEAQLEQLKASMANDMERERIELERWKAKLSSDTQIYIEQMKLGMQVQQAALDADNAEYAQEQAQDDNA